MVQWLRLLASSTGTQVPFLVGELRSHMPLSQNNNSNNNNKIKAIVTLSILIHTHPSVPCTDALGYSPALPFSPKVPVLQNQEVRCHTASVTDETVQGRSPPPASHPCFPCPPRGCSGLSLPFSPPYQTEPLGDSPHFSEEKPEAGRRKVAHSLWPEEGGCGEGQTSVTLSYFLYITHVTSDLWVLPLGCAGFHHCPGLLVLPGWLEVCFVVESTPRML